jgi:hypothetical protein
VLQKAIEMGKRLTEQKDKCAHGEWIPWIEANLSFERTTVARYMRCYENREKLNEASVPHLNLVDLARKHPKANGDKPASVPKLHPRHEQIIALHDHGLTRPKIADQLGVSERTVRSSVDRESIERSVEPEITPEMLSLTAQKKLELAIKQEIKRLGAQYQVDLAKIRTEAKAEAHELLVKVLGPARQRELDDARRIIKRRDGIMDKKTYTKIRSCLHPDWVLDPKQKQRYEEAFHLFTQLERLILSEKESPTQFGPPLPKTSAEWDELKRQATMARQAKRTAKGGIRQMM